MSTRRAFLGSVTNGLHAAALAWLFGSESYGGGRLPSDEPHGGIIFSVLDDVMANWFYLQGARGYTAKSEIRYREPMPVGATAALECRMVKRKGRLVQLRAVATNRDTGKLIAECDGSFMLEDFGSLGAA